MKTANQNNELARQHGYYTESGVTGDSLVLVEFFAANS